MGCIKYSVYTAGTSTEFLATGKPSLHIYIKERKVQRFYVQFKSL